MDGLVAGNDAAILQDALAAIRVGDVATRLSHYDDAGSKIPGL